MRPRVALHPRHGLIFEIRSGGYVGGSDLYVRLTADLPASTRRVVLREPLAATCDVPGEHARKLAGFWNHRWHQFSTPLVTDRADVSGAERATVCALFVGTLRPTPDLADFSAHVFSRVRMR